ncbi:MAG: hypothetical protein JHC33_15565, partial [Ignisphaera sp.]|nr:hypothetical protein [Ignisphaera sp.]
ARSKVTNNTLVGLGGGAGVGAAAGYGLAHMQAKDMTKGHAEVAEAMGKALTGKAGMGKEFLQQAIPPIRKLIAGTRVPQVAKLGAGIGLIGAVGKSFHDIKKLREKKATFDYLIDAGVDFEDAVDLVKEAQDALTKKELSRAGGNAFLSSAFGGIIGADLGHLAVKGISKMAPAKAKATIDSLRGIGRLAGGAGLGSWSAKESIRNSLNKHQEKKAAFDYLIEAGVDFEDAANLVKEASVQVYGE